MFLTSPNVWGRRQVPISPYDSDAANGSSITMVDRTVAVLNNVMIRTVGVYSTNALTYTMKVVKRVSAGTYDVVVSQSFSHPGGGWSDCVLTTPYITDASSTFYLGVFEPAATLSFTLTGITRAFVSASDVTGSGQTFTEGTGLSFPLRYNY